MPISTAERRGFQRVWGIVLPENRSMLTLGEKLGFQINKHPGAEKEFELVISLRAHDRRDAIP